MSTQPQLTVTGELSKAIPETLEDIKTGFQTIYGRLFDKSVSLLKAYPVRFFPSKEEARAGLSAQRVNQLQAQRTFQPNHFKVRQEKAFLQSKYEKGKLQEEDQEFLSHSPAIFKTLPFKKREYQSELEEDIPDSFDFSQTDGIHLSPSMNLIPNLDSEELPLTTRTYKIDKDSNEGPTQAKTEKISFDRLKIAFQDLNKISWDGLSKITTLFFICISPVYSKFTFFMGFVAGTILAIHNHCEEKGMAELVYQGKDLKSRSIRHLILSTFAHVSSKIFSTAGKVFPILRSGFVLSTALSGFTLGYELSDFLLERFDLNPETNPTWEVREQQHLRNESAKKIQKEWKAYKLRNS